MEIFGESLKMVSLSYYLLLKFMWNAHDFIALRYK